VYFRITRNVFEVDSVNGLNFLSKIRDSILGELISKMEFCNIFISH